MGTPSTVFFITYSVQNSKLASPKRLPQSLHSHFLQSAEIMQPPRTTSFFLSFLSSSLFHIGRPHWILAMCSDPQNGHIGRSCFSSYILVNSFPNLPICSYKTLAFSASLFVLLSVFYTYLQPLASTFAHQSLIQRTRSSTIKISLVSCGPDFFLQCPCVNIRRT